MGQEQEQNTLDFVPRLSFLPIEWRTIGEAFGIKDRSGSAASGRCSFVVKEGVDAAELSTTGRVIEGLADVGFGLKLNTLAIGVTAGNMTFRTGLDNPVTAVAQRTGEDSVPSFKIIAAKQFKDENYVAVSYDTKQQKPELSACWTGDAKTERATLLVRVDPVMRALKLSAAVSSPGPEWRKVLYNDETDRLEYPADDGARHTLYVQHEARSSNLLHATRIGCRLDLGRLANYVADYFDYYIEERIPDFVWNIPFLPRLYNLIVPAEDDDQRRYNIMGWELEVTHDFSRGPKPILALCKSFKRGGAVAASYDTATEEVGLTFSARGLTVGARVGRLNGQSWKKPSLHLSVEPLTLLC